MPWEPKEQRRVVERVDRLMALCDRLEAKLTAARHDAERLMRAVLEEALAALAAPAVVATVKKHRSKMAVPPLGARFTGGSRRNT